MSNFYRVLGVTQRANDAQIKLAYRKLAKACHPDLNGDDKQAEHRFKEICHAYKTLSKPETRAAYDTELARERTHARRRLRSAAVTMSASFVLTIGSGLLVAVWLRVDGIF